MNKKSFTNRWISERIGALPSPFDPRNLKYMRLPTVSDATETPEMFEGLEEFSPTNYGRSQGSVGSCVGWDWSYCYETELELLNQHKSIERSRGRTDGLTVEYISINMSAGWAYQESRKCSLPPVPASVEGSTNFGAVRAAKRLGIVTELTVPTDITAPFNFFNETEEMYVEAYKYHVSSYHNIPNDPESIKAAIYGLLHELPYDMPDGLPGKAPLMSAFPVYANFKDSYDDGIVPMPEGKLLGGHSSPIFGWKIIDGKKYWINFGSWGTSIADEGIFYIPEEYPFYPNDWWLLKIAKTAEPPKPTCINPRGNGLVNILNIFKGEEKYYYGTEVK